MRWISFGPMLPGPWRSSSTEEQTAGIRLLYAEEIVAISLHQALGPGEHTDEQVRAFVSELFKLLMTAVNEAVKAVHIISVVYIVDRFRS
jgi:hypothetical protein